MRGERTFVFTFMLFRRWIASCRIYPNACWYAAAWSRQNTSLAEFFIRLMDGSVCAVVDLEDRIRVKYVFYSPHANANQLQCLKGGRGC